MDRLYLHYYDPAVQGGVTAFRAEDCTGDFGFFPATKNKQSTAWYNLDEIKKRHLENDAITSVMVPYGYDLKVWIDNGFISNSKVIHGPAFEDNNQ
jgi:hypothetical protein